MTQSSFFGSSCLDRLLPAQHSLQHPHLHCTRRLARQGRIKTARQHSLAAFFSHFIFFPFTCIHSIYLASLCPHHIGSLYSSGTPAPVLIDIVSLLQMRTLSRTY
jgi:hypothetical protein